MMSINYSEAKKLLEKYGLPPERISHSEGVAKTAYALARRINSLHPELKLKPESIRIAGLLHDIGRSIDEGDHVINSITILKNEGLHEIATLVKHGVSYESSKLNGNEDKSLAPDTISNKIVAYADSRFRLSPVTLDERIKDIKTRKKNNKRRLILQDMSMERIRNMEKEILQLADLDKNCSIINLD